MEAHFNPAMLTSFFKYNTNLRKLDVMSCHRYCKPFQLVATILSGGSTLEEFHSMDNPNRLNIDGLEDIERILCDTTSFETTNLSNHTFCKLDVWRDSEDGDSSRRMKFSTKLGDCLKLNKNAIKAEVVQEKIRLSWRGERKGEVKGKRVESHSG